jgi:hypothetical protein
MRRSTTWAAVFLCVACGGRTDSLAENTSDAGGLSSSGGTIAAPLGTAGGGRIGTGRGGTLGIGGVGVSGSGLRPALGGAAGRGGSGVGGSGPRPALGGAAGRGGSGLIFFGGTAGRGGGGTGGRAIGGSTSVAALCVQLPPGSCERCLCNACSSELSACAADQACLLIAACVVQTGCLMTGVGCFSPTTCGSIIDNVGGSGSPSVELAMDVAMCRLMSSCGC